jgi:hypothetical protein
MNQEKHTFSLKSLIIQNKLDLLCLDFAYAENPSGRWTFDHADISYLIYGGIRWARDISDESMTAVASRAVVRPPKRTEVESLFRAGITFLCTTSWSL